MKKVDSTVWYLVVFVFLAAIFTGFMLTTQAGQGLDAIQNDGYAGSGSVLIALGSAGLAWWMLKMGKKKNGKK